MSRPVCRSAAAVAVMLWVFPVAAIRQSAANATPGSDAVVEAVLTAAGVRRGDVFYDVGCGDGRLSIAASLRQAAVVCVEFDASRLKGATANIQQAGANVATRLADAATLNVSGATVVALRLLPSTTVKLAPALKRDLKPGARIVSVGSDLGEWLPDESRTSAGRLLHLWRIQETRLSR